MFPCRTDYSLWVTHSQDGAATRGNAKCSRCHKSAEFRRWGQKRTPRAPGRAHVSLLPSGPGEVRRDTATRGVCRILYQEVRHTSTQQGLTLIATALAELPSSLMHTNTARVSSRILEDSPSGLWRSLGKRVGETLGGSNPPSSASCSQRPRFRGGRCLRLDALYLGRNAWTPEVARSGKSLPLMGTSLQRTPPPASPTRCWLVHSWGPIQLLHIQQWVRASSAPHIYHRALSHFLDHPYR